MKVCRLADQNKDEDDLPEPQDAPQAHDSDSNSESQSMDDMTGMGFDPNDYSPIPPVGNAAVQQGAALPTSMPKPVEETDLNISDRSDSRGRANTINSFANNQEQVGTQKKFSKGGKVKSSQLRVSLSLAPAIRCQQGTQVGYRYNAPPVEDWTT